MGSHSVNQVHSARVAARRSPKTKGQLLSRVAAGEEGEARRVWLCELNRNALRENVAHLHNYCNYQYIFISVSLVLKFNSLLIMTIIITLN